MSVGLPIDYYLLSDADKKAFSKRPICGVVTIAIVAKIPFQVAWDYFRGIKPPQWKGALHSWEIIGALKHFGVKLEMIENQSLWRKLPLNKAVVALNMKKHNDVFVVTTRKHVQVVRGMNVMDQSGDHFIGDYWANKRRIIGIYRVANLDKISNIDITSENLNMEIDMNVNKNTKIARAKVIVETKQKEGLRRKDIISLMVDELETTWGAASMFYHKVQKQLKAEADATPAAEPVGDHVETSEEA